MILSTGYHQLAPPPTPDHHELSGNQKGASRVAAMPLSSGTMVPNQQGYQSSCMVKLSPPPPSAGGQDQYTEFLALAAVDLAKWGVRLDGSLRSHEMVTDYKRKHDEQSALVLGRSHPQQHQQTIVVDRLLLSHVSLMHDHEINIYFLCLEAHLAI